ncbi:MAG: MBL fold metallo-hydrolase, partial [archaeon]|nr:MBL fold metallo-hydrolase [archaeon]
MTLTFKEIKDEIEKLVPKHVNYSVDLEAGNIALITSDFEAFGGGDGLIGKIAKTVKRKIVIRPPLEDIKSQEDALTIIKEILPDEAGLGDVYFDECSREVILQCEQPGDAVGRKGANIKDIRDQTGWSVIVERKPPLFSRTVHDVREYRNQNSEERRKLLKEFGLNIHRPTRTGATWARITALGSYREVGRACHLVTTNESRVMIDVGVNIASDTDPMPFFTAPEALPLEKLDAVVLTHSHLDHAGMLPVLFKYGYRGPVYCTPPTRDLMLLLQTDYLKVGGAEGKRAPYDMEDIRTCMLHVVDVNWNETTDIAPDVKLTFHNA